MSGVKYWSAAIADAIQSSADYDRVVELHLPAAASDDAWIHFFEQVAQDHYGDESIELDTVAVPVEGGRYHDVWPTSGPDWRLHVTIEGEV